ncbi:MAG: phenylacetate--CoA ligase family protein [Candidatus Methylomirabilis sp.]
MGGIDRSPSLYNPELEAMSAARRQAYQAQRLGAAVKHAHDHSANFRLRLEAASLTAAAIKGPEDLANLPVLKKSTLLQLQKQDPPFGGLLAVPLSEISRIYQSPGPIHEPEGRAPDYWRLARAFYAGGFRAGDVVQVTFAYHVTPGGWICDSGLRALGCIVVPAGVGNTETQVQLLRDLRVTGFVGTAAFLSTLLTRAEELGYDVASDLCLRVASVGGAMMAESMRQTMADRYRLLVRQTYAIGDLGLIGYECQEASGMHVADDLILQIVDPQSGAEVAAGEPGEVVVTLFDRVYPLIRFGTGDLSAITTEPCLCGRTSSRLTRILGRVDEVTKIKGMFVHPRQVDEVARAFPEVRRYQVVVRLRGHDDEMTLRVELASGVEPEPLLTKLTEKTKDLLKIKAHVEAVPPGTIADNAKIILDERRWN